MDREKRRREAWIRVVWMGGWVGGWVGGGTTYGVELPGEVSFSFQQRTQPPATLTERLVLALGVNGGGSFEEELWGR